MDVGVFEKQRMLFLFLLQEARSPTLWPSSLRKNTLLQTRVPGTKELKPESLLN